MAPLKREAGAHPRVLFRRGPATVSGKSLPISPLENTLWEGWNRRRGFCRETHEPGNLPASATMPMFPEEEAGAALAACDPCFR